MSSVLRLLAEQSRSSDTAAQRELTLSSNLRAVLLLKQLLPTAACFPLNTPPLLPDSQRARARKHSSLKIITSPCLFVLLYRFCDPAPAVLPSLLPQQLRDRKSSVPRWLLRRGHALSHKFRLLWHIRAVHGSQDVLHNEATFQGFGTTYQMFCMWHQKDINIQENRMEPSLPASINWERTTLLPV